MFEALVIMLREGVEAALVIGITLVVLRRSGRRDLEPPVFWGLGLAVLAIQVQDDEGAGVAQKFVDDTKVTFTILRDVNDSVTGSYQIRGLPTTILIDRNGIVRDMILGGPQTEEALELKITTLLK